MGARSSGRESALQMLFAMEAGGGSAERVLAAYWRETPGDPEGREYADQVVRGVADELTAVDEAIRKASTNWRLERMARVAGQGSVLARLAISSAVAADDQPLLPAFVPARSMACSIVSVLSTPKTTGTPVSRLILAMPLAASPAT